jgi:hypothetical protein
VPVRVRSRTLAHPSARHHEGVPDVFAMPVTAGSGQTFIWSLELSKPEGNRVSLSLNDGHGRSWEAIGGDVFDALMRLRLKAEPDGVQLCCNGARRNAWSSGMQRDMGEGYGVYLLPAKRSTERPPAVKTLDPAPPSEVVTVALQRAAYEAWLGHPLPEIPEIE